MYMVFKSGGSAPKIIHSSIDSAIKEANRLAEKEAGRFFVMEVQHIYKSKISIEVEL